MMVSCLESPFHEQLDVLEYFSGKSRVSRAAARSGYNACAYDISFDKKGPATWKNGLQRKRSHMDINGEAGLALPGNPSAPVS